MRTRIRLLLSIWLAAVGPAVLAADKPACDRTFTLALHDHGLLYSQRTGEGIEFARPGDDERLLSVAAWAQSRILG